MPTVRRPSLPHVSCIRSLPRALVACLLSLLIPANAIAGQGHTLSLHETGRLRLVSRHDFTLHEQGAASGTIAGTIYVTLTAVSSSRVTAQVKISTRSGSIAGTGSGGYRRAGKSASFSGSLSIGDGSGGYSHVHGSGLRFSGTIDESANDAITVRVEGTVSE